MQFTERIWPKIQPLWDSYMTHPFVQGLGDGSLPLEKFKHWLAQDYVYLVEYARLFAIGTAKAPNLEIMNTYAKGLDGVLFMEMNLHRQYVASFGMAEETLLATQPSAVNLAYTSYMLNKAQSGGIDNVGAALLACSWSYNHIGLNLAKEPGALTDNPYASWIEMYAGEEFTALNDAAMALMNQLTEGKPAHELDALEDIVLKTGYFEYLFWDMCWEEATWPATIPGVQ